MCYISGMTRAEQAWIAAWRRAGPALERIRREELRRLDHRTVIASFDDAFLAINRHPRPDTTSGLVEQQRLFARLRPSP
jgi:hypothetical protein